MNRTFTTHVWGWWDREPIRLSANPRRIGPNARRAFTQGQCHALALALHELTGWNVGGVHWLDNGYPDHVVTELPDGRRLDINGWNYEEDYEPVDPLELTESYPNEGYMDPDLRAGRIYAPLVLQTYVPTDYWAPSVRLDVPVQTELVAA